MTVQQDNVQTERGEVIEKYNADFLCVWIHAEF